MAELKTKQNNASVEGFLQKVEDEKKREDCYTLLKMYTEITGQPAVMWGAGMVGFGKYHYKSERSSQEGDWMLGGFSPRKAALTVYLTVGFSMNDALLKKLGPHKVGKGCLYIKRLSDVDESVLRELISFSYKEMKKLHNVTE